jgi:hypothetical protein
VKPSSPSLWPGALNYAGRVGFSIVVIAMLLAALNLVFMVHKRLLDTDAGLKNLTPFNVSRPAAGTARNVSVHPFWPEFPHDTVGNVQSSVLNGIQVITEEWDCGASADDILSYYREQMTARGWEDTTKQTYGFQPEMHTSLDDYENQQFIDKYRNVMDSTLMLNRGDWTLRVSTEPSPNGFHQTTVRFYAAQTASIMDVAEEATASVIPKGRLNQLPLDVVQKSGTEDYHTTIGTKNEPSKQAFIDALADAEAKGWKPKFFRQQTHGYFAWLIKGKQYGALSVSDVQPGQACTVTLIEVTPH